MICTCARHPNVWCDVHKCFPDLRAESAAPEAHPNERALELLERAQRPGLAPLVARALRIQLYCTLVTACFVQALRDSRSEHLPALRQRVQELANELGFTVNDAHTLPEMLAEPLRELLGDG